ncbi:MAG: putative Ig domain-containing protein [Gemmatimonadota bacterium]|nr:MAG: putative Ig domain-containing protein [Gemmatimonadota bacterium]
MLPLLHAWRDVHRVSETTRNILASSMQRPTLSGPETVITTAHFRIHYTTSGVDAVSQGYAENVSDYAEESWSKEVEEMGWDAPPPDGIDGDEYDFYIVDSGMGGWVGYCQPEQDGPDPNQEDVTSYIVIAAGLGLDLAQVTVAHEFNHACQFSYSDRESDFWYENCATWMEDMVYDRVNDYSNYISSGWENPLYWPELPITRANGEYEYGASVWVFYLTERHTDNDMPRRVWDRNGANQGNHTLDDIDHVLSTHYGSSFEEALKEYSVWRYFTGSRDDGQHFSEGGSWIDSYVGSSHIHTSYPAEGNQDNKPPDYYGTNFIQLNRPALGVEEGLHITFDGQDGRDWAAMVAYYPGVGFEEMNLGGGDAGSMSADWGSSSRIILIPVVLSSWGTRLAYTYTAQQGADATPPTMEPIAEPQGAWYSTSPAFSNFGFDDGFGLDDGWYQLNSCSGAWLELFTNWGGVSWDDDGWSVPGFDDLSQGSHTIYFKVDDSADNVGGGCSWSWWFSKDTVPPEGPTDVASPSHDVSLWSDNPTLEIIWTDAADPAPGSGLDGYSVVWNRFPSVVPDQTVDVGKGEERATSPPLSGGDDHYFHIRCGDVAGNWGNTFHVGPFWIDLSAPTDGTISVHGGDDTTTVAIVGLDDLRAADALSGMGAGARMRFSNDGTLWSEPEAYAGVKSGWDLTAAEFGGDLFDGVKTVSVQFRDVAGNWSEPFQDDIFYDPSLTIVTNAMQDGYVGFAYNETLFVVGGTPPFSWSIVAGSLPEGLTLEPTEGVISGTPSTAGIMAVSVEVRDSEMLSHIQDLSITIHEGLKGDVNDDGMIDIIDALLGVNIVLGTEEPSDLEYWAADCNDDDLVDIVDVLGIVNVTLGLGTCLTP